MHQLIIVQRCQRQIGLCIERAIHEVGRIGQRRYTTRRHHGLGHDVHLLLQFIDFRRVLRDLLLVHLIRLDLLLVLLVQGQQSIHLVLDINALLLFQLLSGADPISAVCECLRGQFDLFACLLWIVVAKYVAVAKDDAIAAPQADAGLDFFAVDVA